jgi:RimJ/RimL family protein N-acetyltransferase
MKKQLVEESVFAVRRSAASLAAERRALEAATHRITARRQRDLLPGKIVTPRLVLRAPMRGDVPDLVRIADNKAIAAMMSSLPSPYTRADAIGFVEISAQRDDERPYVITLNGQLIGITGFSFSKDEPPEGGYWLGEDYWGKGYATEAFKALIEAAHTTRAYPVVQARALAENLRSRAVLERVGFGLKSQSRTMFGASERDVALYQMEQPKWM